MSLRILLTLAEASDLHWLVRVAAILAIEAAGAPLSVLGRAYR